MHYAPFNYEQINLVNGTYQPSMIKKYNNAAFRFWERALFQRALSVLDINLPEDWAGSIRDFFLYCLYRFGYVAIFEHADYGLINQPCSLSGYDLYYRPTRAIIANPAFNGSLDLQIGKECEILKLTPDYFGIWDIIAYYAEKLATLDNAINISLINNKYAFMLGAKNKQASEALKKMLDKVNAGEPAVIFDQKLQNDPNDKEQPWQFWERGNLKESYMTTEQLADFQTILHNFDTEIGIPTLPIEKKERMITDEATSKQIDAISRSSIWLDTLNSSAELVNAHYGTNIKASYKFDMEVVNNGTLNADRTV